MVKDISRLEQLPGDFLLVLPPRSVRLALPRLRSRGGRCGGRGAGGVLRRRARRSGAASSSASWSAQLPGAVRRERVSGAARLRLVGGWPSDPAIQENTHMNETRNFIV